MFGSTSGSQKSPAKSGVGSQKSVGGSQKPTLKGKNSAGGSQKPVNGVNTGRSNKPSSPRKGGGRGNIFGFGGTSFSSPGSGGGGLKTAGKTGTQVVKPGNYLYLAIKIRGSL